jgi:hypothetical protein
VSQALIDVDKGYGMGNLPKGQSAGGASADHTSGSDNEDSAVWQNVSLLELVILILCDFRRRIALVQTKKRPTEAGLFLE